MFLDLGCHLAVRSIPRLRTVASFLTRPDCCTGTKIYLGKKFMLSKCTKGRGNYSESSSTLSILTKNY